MMKAFISPGRYVQGSGITDRLAEFVSPFGKRPVFLRDKIVARLVGARVESNLNNSGLTPVVVEFAGESSRREIARVGDIARRNAADIVIGVGGGKTLDTAKGAANDLNIPVVIVPTTASTDAPTSALSVIYSDGGVFEEYRFYKKNPDMVLVDTQVIAEAPVRFLVAGMGDALATWFEAESASKTMKTAGSGGAPTMAALALARLCHDTLREHGVVAKLAAEQQVVTPSLEKIIEANTLLSGLGFESAGLAAAHAVHNGLTVLDPTHEYLHGEKVAFGLLTQLNLEERPIPEIEEVLEFCLAVGLPVCLADIGLKQASREDLRKVAAAACAQGETMANEPLPVTPEMVMAAMIQADAMGSIRSQGCCGEAHCCE
jgi:glycerol dehydrogenase